MAADALTALVIFVAISMLRFGPNWLNAWDRTGVPAVIAGASWAALWVSALWLHDLYRMRHHWSLMADAGQIIRATALLAIGVFVLLFAFQLPTVSRLLVIGIFVAQLVVALISRVTIRTAFRLARSRGQMVRYVLVVGTSKSAEKFANLIERHRELGLRVIGHLGPDADETGRKTRRPVLGRYEDALDVLHSRVVDEVAIVLPASEWSTAEAITRMVAEAGKVVRVLAEPADAPMPHLVGSSTEHYAGLTIQSLVYGPDRVVSLFIKRLIDVVGATLLLIILGPLLVAIAVAILVREGRPILFRQTRVGLHGRPFEVVKFRTMVRDAETLQGELAGANEIEGPAFKVTDDPRITGIGRFLRKTSADEFPQLWNVLRGEMSLVGPRPPLPAEVAEYDVWHRRRLAMKPGITGLWQVSARHNPDFNRWVSIDLDYIDRWSLWLDLKILARTVPAMLEGR